MARLPHLPATPAIPATPALTRAARAWSAWLGWLGWFAVAAGAVLCVLGWYGVSGESVIEQQLPYLASATIPGAALIVAGVLLVAARPSHRTQSADQRIETLYALLVDAGDAGAAELGAPPPHEAQAESQLMLAVPGGTLYHRRDCPLVADKPTAEPVDAAAVAGRSLVPCPVCEPPPLPSAGAEQPGPERPAPDQPAPDQSASGQPAANQPGQPAADHPDRPDRPDHPDRPVASDPPDGTDPPVP